MKSILALAVAAIAFTSASANARPNCPGGQGYWEEVVRNVRVCDTSQETYTVTFKDCRYHGILNLGHLWHQPTSYLPRTKVIWDTKHAQSSCPSTEFRSESTTYWYKNSSGYQSIATAQYTGWVNKISENTRTEERTRTVETNCRTEQRVTRVFRCGYEP
ncbi:MULTISPECIES: hypothetical protein [Pseudoalteromonas]|uniref:Uncharacterized protein n=1 Tax=Pseudoalteromonas luteoviolacea (strain 2ta16) TaxID=1353533 RepID=V4HIL6_PSEL2|nr:MULTISPECIES: hypothetical protein [Pseudoalteromonas]ESP90650.1 hypothetical protein PL2TA16_01754 [Pseudoalteromonas luteoviolacea 2ta16]KZN41774.1 hypothetical protein N483_13975 [Pseudoalteromonas luteoviolacea NCIMB 1944]MCG7548067.1 hypothetical protein [Pseudoalteromonas sp. Of7M-16]